MLGAFYEIYKRVAVVSSSLPSHFHTYLIIYLISAIDSVNIKNLLALDGAADAAAACIAASNVPVCLTLKCLQLQPVSLSPEQCLVHITVSLFASSFFSSYGRKSLSTCV